jgi:predicted deacylase
MHSERHVLTHCMPGTTRELVSLHFGKPGSGPKALIQASLHADEPPGLLVAYHLRRELAALESEQRIRGEIVLVPMANPVGSAQRLLGRALGRFELAGGENFNRNYADLSAATFARLQAEIDTGHVPTVAAVRSALRSACDALPADSELMGLRRTLLRLAIDADLVLDLHCDNEAVLHLYTTTPVWPAQEPLARLLRAEMSLLAVESGGEPFDEACSMVWARLGRRYREHTGKDHPWPDACVAVTLELRGETDVSHELAQRDAQAILAWLSHRGMIDAALPELPALIREPRPLEGSVPVLTPRGGVLGQCIAEVIDPLTGEASELTSAVDGLLYARESVRIVHAGMSVAKVAGCEAIRSGHLLSA